MFHFCGMYNLLQSEKDSIPIIGRSDEKYFQNKSEGLCQSNDSVYSIPRCPIEKREHASQINWRDWEKNFNSELVMSNKSIWETNFQNNREKRRFYTEITEMQSQRKIMKCKTKKELDKLKEEYARMMALSCVYKKFEFAKFDPLREKREKLTQKNLEMFEESYKAHTRCRSRSESPKSERSTQRQKTFYRLRSPSPKVVDRRSSQQRTTGLSRSPSPGETVKGIKGFRKLFPAIANKKPNEDKKKTFSVKGSSVTTPKIRPQSDIPSSVNCNVQVMTESQREGANISQSAQQNLEDSKQATVNSKKTNEKERKDIEKEKFWINPQDSVTDKEQEEGHAKNLETRILAPNSSTALMFAAYKQRFENTRNAHSEPPMRLRFMMQLREAAAKLEPIPERPKSFMPDEFRSIQASRQFMKNEVDKVLHAWSPSVKRRKETQRMLKVTPKPIALDREKTLSAIMREFRVYVEESRADGRLPPIYKERYIFPELG